MRPLFIFKLALLNRARNRWPIFASYEEDMALRKPKWNHKLRERKGKKFRIIFWDMTGIKTYKFSAADKQRVTWSKYYATNCVKGAGGIQPCTWGVTVPLWTGRVSDTDYHQNSGYVQAMKEFQEKDLVPVYRDTITGTHAILGSVESGARPGCAARDEGPAPGSLTSAGTIVEYEVVPFTHVLDKGYQVTRFNWAHGKQRTVQPVFGRSNQKFKGEDTLFSGMVASLRSGNERWILVCKRPGFIKEGFKPGMSPVVFDDVWLGWGFQANFMYKPAM